MRIVRYFPDADMRNGHDGLFKLAKKNGVDIRTIGNEEFVVFVNRRKNHVKMAAPGNVIAHYKSYEGKIDPRVIQHLPNAFNGGKIDYDRAMLKVLRSEFPRAELY